MISELKQFSSPDELRTMSHGKFEIVNIRGVTVGRASYEPGWKWSIHVAPQAGTPLRNVQHVGLVVSGKCAVVYENGTTEILAPGDLFDVPSTPHDAWVFGDEVYVFLHFLGEDKYARK